mgnify:FL=1
MQRGFAPILIVILIAVLGVGGYFVYTNYSKPQTKPPQYSLTPAPTTDPRANWKTIKNTAFSWEIKYPSDWEILTPVCDLPAGECSNVMMRGTNIFNGECSDPKLRCGNLSVEVVVPHTGNVTATMSAKQYIESFNPSIPIVEPSTEVIINGETGYQQTVQNFPGSSAITRTITILHNGKVYYLGMTEGYYHDNYNIHTTNDWKLLSIFNQILSTFKFLDDRSVSQINCAKDDDCGIDPCACAAVRKESVGACATYCGEIVSKCVNKQCSLVPL